MVLAERNSDIVRNGRRSRGASPNGNVVGTGGTPETSSDDDNSIKRNSKNKTKQSEYEDKIRVGRDYQAVCPSLVPEPERKPELLNDRALLVWSPTKEIPDTKLEEYISVAKEKYGYNGEQALGMLFWHKHDLERAVMDLQNFTPFPDEWTVEDKVLFEQAFQFHGKSFRRIRQMLPDKSIACLVKYYYSWKKKRHHQSVVDRQEKAKVTKEGSENGSDEESDKVQLSKQNISLTKRKKSESLEDLRQNESVNCINSRWTNEELLLAVNGVRKYGKDYQTIADTLGTKTDAHVRTFYLNYRRRYNLDQVLKEHEAEKEIQIREEQTKKSVQNAESHSITEDTTSSKSAEDVSSTKNDTIVTEFDMNNDTADQPQPKHLATCLQQDSTKVA